jgi:hypothetical protein
MARYNLKVNLFICGSTTFNATASGVYTIAGSADGAEVVNRMVALPYGGIHDLDGTGDAARRPPLLWQDFLFVSTSPYGHGQYSTLEGLSGKVGTLHLEIPTMSIPESYSATARLMRVEGEWKPPYMQNKTNWLYIRATWQLKTYPA